MNGLPDRPQRIRRVCERGDLQTYDLYDIWKTKIGFCVKDFYNHHRILGLPAAALLTLFDLYVNNRARLLYQRQEYPIVRALAAQALMQLYVGTRDESLLVAVRQHLEWLRNNSCVGYSGPCWGLGFPYAVSSAFHYSVNTPLTTMTPYALEAFVNYTEVVGDTSYVPVINGIFEFFEKDVQVMEETDDYLVTSYAAMCDRKVVNAVSYAMYAYGLMLPYLDAAQRERIERKIRKLYRYIVVTQRADGSWPYSEDPPVFVDCFHSCIVIKNIIKANKRLRLKDCEQVVARGYQFLKKATYVEAAGLFKRFAQANKPGVIRFDLYDNAEMLNLACIMEDMQLVSSLERRIEQTFVNGENIWSQVDLFGLKHGRDFLRWAVMPYLYASATIEVMGLATAHDGFAMRSQTPGAGVAGTKV